MSTYREDLHLGHKVPIIETDDIADHAITEGKLADGSVSTRVIQEKAVTEPKLDDDAVSTRIIQDGAVTKSKIAKGAVEDIMKPITDDLQNQIDSFNEHGFSVSNVFGDDPHIGISQKTLTEAINSIWRKIEDITGEQLRGFSWTITPSFFISETEETIHVSVVPIIPDNIIEHLSLKVNGVEVASMEEPAYSFDYDVILADTSTIRVDAKILGVPYYREQEVTRYRDFFIGAGQSYTDIMDVQHTVNDMRTEKNITVSDGDYIFVVINESIASEFIRADINGVEIPFNSRIETIQGKSYRVYTSQNTYNVGTYNIDING